MRKWLARKIYPKIFEKHKYSSDAQARLRSNLSDLQLKFTANEKILLGIDDILKFNNSIVAITETTSKNNMGEKVVLFNPPVSRSEFHVRSPYQDYNYLTLFSVIDIEEKSIYIEDIQCAEIDCDKGYGSIAMKYLLDYAERKSIKKIHGRISSQDSDHYPRLIHFYEKFGFKVDMNLMRTELLLD